MNEYDVYDIIVELVGYVENQCNCVENFYDFGENYDEVEEKFFEILEERLLK